MIKNILWDFDGVILDSMPIRDFGFREIVKEHSTKVVEEFIKYHQYNAGLSRFVKIKYFYNELLNQEISEFEIQMLADKFSDIMKKELIDKKYLIKESIEFIQKNYRQYNCHIVSGSEEKELGFLCDKLDLSPYFISIHGSPTAKNDLVKNLLNDYGYLEKESILIGDSINDYNAAVLNGLDFYGFNNRVLQKHSKVYIESFTSFYV